MAVTFTSNISLAKPDETELAKEWARNSQLADDNNLIIKDKADINLTSYTPSWIGPSTNPSAGAGTIVGEYYEIQGFIFGSFTIKCLDPGVASGTGSGGYGISLPVAVDETYHTISATLNDTPGLGACIGEGYFTDSSAVNTSGMTALDIVKISSTYYARMMTEAYTGKTSHFVGPGVPVSLATGDAMSGSFVYKKA